MIRLRHKLLIRSLRLLDLTVLVAAAILVIYFRPSIPMLSSPNSVPTINRIGDSVGMLLLAFGWIGIFDYCIRYRADRLTGFAAQFRDLTKATTLAAFWFLMVGAIFKVGRIDSIGVLAFWILTTSAGTISRILLRWTVVQARRSGYNYRYLLIAGVNAHSREIAEKILQSPELGYKLIGFLSDPGDDDGRRSEQEGDPAILGSTDELQEVLERERVDEIMVCLSVESKFQSVSRIIHHAKDLGIVLRIVPQSAEGALLKKMHIEEFGDDYVITLFREQLLFQLFLKRLIDLSVAAVGLVMLSPLMLLVALLIKWTSSGPVFFTQDRVGMNQRRFLLYKFRSMVADAEEQKKKLIEHNENDGPAFKMKHDPRITPIGRFIRKTSIDELPQLFNVLKGEMSLVGPRPPLPDEVSQYKWLFRRRLSVKPGITCIWQVSGRSDVSFEEWMKMDKFYVENWSLLLDLKILLKTIPAVLLCRGSA